VRSGRAIRSAAPRIDTNYLAEQVDRDTLVAGIGILREIYRQPAFRDLWEAEVLPGPDARSAREILEFARARGGTVFHASGTCRMGADEGAVVDPRCACAAWRACA
jgi:choline dehydrogenase